MLDGLASEWMVSAFVGFMKWPLLQRMPITPCGAGVRFRPIPNTLPNRFCDLGLVAPSIELEGNQLGELVRDVCHRLFYSAQAASRAEQGADVAERFIRRVVHDGNEQITR